MSNILERAAKIREKFLARKPVYLLDDFDEAVFRWDPGGDTWFKKRKGKKEFEIMGDTDSVMEAKMQALEITLEAYEKY
jgi:hypothetical protein